jgi:hypothetical protein
MVQREGFYISSAVESYVKNGLHSLCDFPWDLIEIGSPKLEIGGYTSKEIYQAVGAHIACTILSSCLDWFRLVHPHHSPISSHSEVQLVSDGICPIMRTRSRLYFQEYLLKGMQLDIKDESNAYSWHNYQSHFISIFQLRKVPPLIVIMLPRNSLSDVSRKC